MKFIVLCP